jgi:hypothetical protein
MMVATSTIQEISQSKRSMSPTVFKQLITINTIHAIVTYGCLPSLSTYALLPYSQKAFYYWSVLIPMAYPLSLLLTLHWKVVSTSSIVYQSIFSWCIAMFIIYIAKQSPCPWLADTTVGSFMIITVWFIMSLTSGFLRIVIGSRIKDEWADEKGMFYYGVSVQIGLLLGSIPIYLAINVFDLFLDRQPCKLYCLTEN